MPLNEELITGFILELVGQAWSWLIGEWVMPTMLGLVEEWPGWLFMVWLCGCIHALTGIIRQGFRARLHGARAKRICKARKARQRRLLSRLRRLPEADQIRIMNWLDNRFGKGGCG